jgi:hypothetical protein
VVEEAGVERENVTFCWLGVFGEISVLRATQVKAGREMRHVSSVLMIARRIMACGRSENALSDTMDHVGVVKMIVFGQIPKITN